MPDSPNCLDGDCTPAGAPGEARAQGREALAPELRRELARRFRDGGPAEGAGAFLDAVSFTLLPVFGLDNLRTSDTDLLRLLADLIDPDLRGGADPVEPDLTEEVHAGPYTIRVWECPACGHTFEDVNGSYERCPHCGRALTYAGGGFSAEAGRGGEGDGGGDGR